MPRNISEKRRNKLIRILDGNLNQNLIGHLFLNARTHNIQKVEDLSMLIEKWRKPTETRRNLQTFSLGADGLGATVFLWDASGKEVKTSNTPVVFAVMEEIKTTLDERIKEVETQIKF